MCNSCQYKENFNIGAGMLDYNPNNALKTFSSEEKEKIEKYIQLNPKSICDINRKVAVGVNDGKEILALATIIKVMGEGNNTREFISYSKELDEGSIKLYDESELLNSKIKCPECSDNLKFQMSGFWD